ncbi:MAG: PH domain-containing protein [Candidatus Bilamarchaeaceae archaeon]
MVETEFTVRCSGRIDYAKAIALGIVFAYAAGKAHSLSFVPAFSLNMAYIIIGGFAALLIIVAFIRAKIQYIDVDSEGITMHSGLINKKTSYIPYRRIDNVKINRNLIERIFGLGSIGVDTAGSNQVEIEMDNIPYHYLERMQAYIKRKSEEAHLHPEEHPQPRRF